jgi:hypothetical protein
MTDHAAQKLTPREMVRAHAYPVLAAVSTVALVVTAVALVVTAVTLAPIGKHAGYQNRCIEEHGEGRRYLPSAVRFCNGQ